MPYWMTHEHHGIAPAFDQGDVDRHKLHGWSLLNVGDSPDDPALKAKLAAAAEGEAESDHAEDLGTDQAQKTAKPPKAQKTAKA